jgi:hypothetical protein
VTAEFLDHQRRIGNDLSTPRPEYLFPGLVPGDRWCVTAANWLRAHRDDAAAFVVLASTHERALGIVPLEVLQQHAIDIPSSPGSLEDSSLCRRMGAAEGSAQQRGERTKTQRARNRRIQTALAVPRSTDQDVPMTGELSPAGETPVGAGRPELRASHQDRDRVVEILRVAAGDGRLSADELDERLEAALTARTYRELAALTADLPPSAAAGRDAVAAQPKDLVRIDCKGSNTSRVGKWVVPKAMEISAVGGTVKLDFTQALITQAELQISASVRGGNLVLVTRPGIEVDAEDIRLIGGGVRAWPAAGWARPVELRVAVSGTAHGGHVVVRPPRRSLWQWLTRRPRKYHEFARQS